MNSEAFDRFRAAAFATVRELVMAVEFAEQSRDMANLGADTDQLDSDSAHNALDAITLLVGEMRELLPPRSEGEAS